jgi:anthranilate phosphoribosyltransferase
VTSPATEHPFAAYIRILGKGKTGTRDLTETEAHDAFAMLLRGDTEPVQAGAFLMLLRVKEETGQELAGFVRACRAEMVPPPPGLAADLDWSSYAGKRHQHPWYLLAMLLLSGAGYRVFVHGAAGHTPGRLYTESAMRALGLPVAADWSDVAYQLDTERLSYLSLSRFCPALHQLIQLRSLLGLRSPVNTLCRMLNPLRAASTLQSVFHPAYAQLHQAADLLLEQPCAIVFKGESGEIEIKPHADTRLYRLQNQTPGELTLARTIAGRVEPVDSPDVEPLRTLWRGENHDEYGLCATLATASVALLTLRPDLDQGSAHALARQYWETRNTGRLD